MIRTTIAAEAATRITMRYSFWTEIFYSMTVHEATPEQVAGGMTTLATDGRNLWICAAHFEPLSRDEQVAEVVHELLHKIWMHCTRRGSRDPYMWNVACDYVVNAFMIRNGFKLGPDWLIDMKYDGWLAEAVYADLMKKQQEEQQQSGSGKPGGGKPGPQLPDGRQDIKEPQGATPEQVTKMEDEIKALVERSIAMAKAMGEGRVPVGMEQAAAKAAKPAIEPWYNHLHRYMQSLRQSEYNWARLNRRTLRTHGIFTPLHYSEALGDVALFTDTSGSCFARAQQVRFTSQLNAILAEAKPRRIHQYYFDTKVYPGQVVEAGEIDLRVKPKGGGGTSFVPIFEQLEQDDIVPEVCIILTDLCGLFPKTEPQYPVVWASIDNRRAPFGDVIHLNE